MDRDGTEGGDAAGHPCRALVVVPSQDGHQPRIRRMAGGRPMSGFLAQLIVDTDPALRIARSERTRAAAALYARAATMPGGGRRRA